MPTIAAPRQTVLFTSCRTLAMERSHFRRIEREFGQEIGLLGLYTAGIALHQKEVLPLAERVVHGGFDRRMVEETEEDFRIHDPLLYLTMRQEMVWDEPWRDLARLVVMSDLTRLGHRVAAFAPDPEVYEYADPQQLELVKEAGVAERDIIFLAKPSHDEPTGSIAFPRDLFVQQKDTVYVAPGEHNPYGWQGFFNWAVGLKRNHSRIGMGGEVIIADNFALLSEQVRPDLAMFGGIADPMAEFLSMTTIGESEHTLKRMGKQVYRIPTGWMELFPPAVIEEVGGDKPILIPADHADMQVLHLPAENALFFSERYYRENRSFLERLVEQVRPELSGTLPDEDGMPVNSLPLPGGGVYMDAAARRSVMILRRLGIRVETTSRPFGSWAWGTNGGIHCATNQVVLPAEKE
ncbi:MAG: hypothetical protein WC529_06705 [Candidatus Margulisiibacteriota bacterium]